MIDDIKRDREAAPAMPFRLIGCDCEQDCVHDDHNRLVKKRRSRVPDMEAALIAAEEMADAVSALTSRPDSANGGRLILTVDVNRAEQKLAAYRAATGAA